MRVQTYGETRGCAGAENGTSYHSLPLQVLPKQNVSAHFHLLAD